MASESKEDVIPVARGQEAAAKVASLMRLGSNVSRHVGAFIGDVTIEKGTTLSSSSGTAVFVGYDGFGYCYILKNQDELVKQHVSTFVGNFNVGKIGEIVYGQTKWVIPVAQFVSGKGMEVLDKLLLGGLGSKLTKGIQGVSLAVYVGTHLKELDQTVGDLCTALQNYQQLRQKAPTTMRALSVDKTFRFAAEDAWNLADLAMGFLSDYLAGKLVDKLVGPVEEPPPGGQLKQAFAFLMKWIGIGMKGLAIVKVLAKTDKATSTKLARSQMGSLLVAELEKNKKVLSLAEKQQIIQDIRNHPEVIDQLIEMTDRFEKVSDAVQKLKDAWDIIKDETPQQMHDRLAGKLARR